MDACKRLNVELCARGIYLSLSDLDDALWLSGVLEAERLGLLDRIAALRADVAADNARDESGAALDPGAARSYVAMLRRACDLAVNHCAVRGRP